jgi:hypothetical protein
MFEFVGFDPFGSARRASNKCLSIWVWGQAAVQKNWKQAA